MSGVFISYRRDDSGGYAGRLFDFLVGRFGEANVFMDLDAIHGGDNFATVIENKVSQCDVLLAVIGERWVTITGADGQPRLAATHDWVRLEIGKALERGVRVIPVLVGHAAMPHEEDLPPELRKLPMYQAVDVRDAHFREDVEGLIALLEKEVPGLRARPLKSRTGRIGMGVLTAIVLAALAGTLATRRGTKRVDSEAIQPAVPGEVVTGGTVAASDARLPTTAAAAPRKALPSKGAASPAANVAGQWMATVTYDWPGAVNAERFHFNVEDGEVSGTASFLGADRGIFDGKMQGDRVSFTTKSISEMDGKTSQDKHQYKGTITGDTIRFSMLTDSEIESHVPIYFTATRVGAK